MVALVAAACAAPYLSGGPVWDDHTLLLGRLAHLDATGLRDLWVSPVGGGEVGTGYYRPLAMTVMALLGRVGVWSLHGATLVAHAVSAGLLARLLKPAPAAVWAAGLFAVHPLASEVLGWASALPDALAVCIGLIAVWVSRKDRVAAGLLTLAALLCKESAGLLLPAFLVAQRAPRSAWVSWAGAVVAALAMRGLVGAGASWAVSGKALFGLKHVLWTVGSMAVPWPITAVRDLHAAPLWGLGVGVAAIVAAAAVAWRFGRRDPGAWAGLALVVLAPVIALPPVLTGYLSAERYAYVGLVGVTLLAASALPELTTPGRPQLLGMLAPAVVLHALLAGRWSTDVALFTDATEALPNSGYAWHFLGQAKAMSGDYRGAADAFGEAVERPQPHPRDGELKLRSLVMAQAYEEANAWAQTLRTEGLTADDLAWRARAAYQAGDRERARALVQLLAKPGGQWDGPPWVPPLARDLGLR